MENNFLSNEEKITDEYNKLIDGFTHQETSAESMVNKKQNKRKKLIITLISVCITIALTALTLGLIFLKPNYYYTEAFTNKTTSDKLLTILKREGKNNLNNDADSYYIEYAYSIGGVDYSFFICYIDENEEFEISFVLSNTYNEITTLFALDPTSNFQSLMFYSICGAETIALGDTRIYAPTFYNDIIISFDEYYGESSNEDLYANLLKENACVLISTINNMLKDYNFSMKEFGFKRFE